MRRITFEELRPIDFTMCHVYGSAWYWKNGDDDDYRRGGRPNNVLHYQVTGTRDYYDTDGRPVAKNEEKSLMFVPCHTRYLTRPVVKEGVGNFGYSFGFDLFDEKGEELLVDEPYTVSHDDEGESIYTCIRRVDRMVNGVRKDMVALKVCMYELLGFVCRPTPEQEQLADEIEAAVRAIRVRPEQNLSISQLCGLCSMSESSFRRKFAQYSGGLSPVQYRNMIRCDKAYQLYRSSNRSLEEIASQLGFCDAAYMCRVYKRLHGHSFREVAGLSKQGWTEPALREEDEDTDT